MNWRPREPGAPEAQPAGALCRDAGGKAPGRRLSHVPVASSSLPTPVAAHPALTLSLGILLANAAVVLWLWTLGRSLLPLERPLQWFSLGAGPQHNSQHLADIYSLVHAAAGAGLHLFLGSAWSFRPLWLRLLLAVASSSVWEMVENTPWVIALFNNLQGPDTYPGDSIVNALSDTAFVVLGFLASRLMPVWAVAATALIAGGLAALVSSAMPSAVIGMAGY